jgi:CheY-like chemotaxis protein
MVERLVHLIDSDTAFAGEVAGALGRYGLQVATFPDGNEALAQKETPSLIILCIDPKRLGWAICNRMKKSPGLKGVPMIVISAEATEKDFDDHKNLKNRAEDYLRKPFAMETLVEHVSPLVGGLADAEAELAMTEDVAIEEELTPEPGGFDDEFGDRTGVVNAADFLVDREPESPFDPASAEDAPLPGMTSDPDQPTRMIPAAALGPGPGVAAPRNKKSAPVPESAPDDLDLGLEQVGEMVKESSRVGKMPGVEGEMARLREERDKLAKEVEDLKARAPMKSEGTGASFTREREFLNLREVINKKEKEVLDLKDAIDGKDRQLLDMKDKLRESERARRDIDEKTLAVEKDLVSAREKVDALGKDKETGLGREKQLKSRLDEAQKKGDKAFAEVDEWKARHAETVERGESEKEALRARHESMLQEAESRHSTALDEANSAFEIRHAETVKRASDTLEQAKASHAATQQNMAENHQQALLDRDQSHADEIAGLRARSAETLRDEMNKADQRLKQELLGADRVRADELAKKEAEHRQLIEQAEADNARAIARMESEHEKTVTALDEQRVSEIHSTKTAHEAEKAKLTAEHEAALGRQRDLQTKQVNELNQAHQGAVDQMRQAHSEALGRANGELDSTKERIIELDGALTTAMQTGERLNAELENARVEVAQRDARIADDGARIAELEAEGQKLQEQLLQAYQRLKTDEAVAGRARKALAIAITLLDENNGAPGKSS